MDKGKLVKWIITIVVIIILAIPIVSEMISNTILTLVSYDDYEEIVSDTSNYSFALLYIDSGSSDTVDDQKKLIKEMIEEYSEDTIETSVDAYFMNSDDLSYYEVYALLGDYYATTGYLFISNGEVIKTISGELTEDELKAYTSEYSMNGIDEDITYYKVADDAAAYKKLVKKKSTVTMAVFGNDGCFYCNQFKAVYNTVAEEYGLDIYYFNSYTYDEDEYQTIMDMGLTIPASCTESGEEELLSDGFNTPLTIFTKNNEVIDCISGYVSKADLITKLETVGMIVEDEDEEE